MRAFTPTLKRLERVYSRYQAQLLFVLFCCNNCLSLKLRGSALKLTVECAFNTKAVNLKGVEKILAETSKYYRLGIQAKFVEVWSSILFTESRTSSCPMDEQSYKATRYRI